MCCTFLAAIDQVRLVLTHLDRILILYRPSSLLLFPLLSVTLEMDEITVGSEGPQDPSIRSEHNPTSYTVPTCSPRRRSHRFTENYLT